MLFGISTQVVIRQKAVDWAIRTGNSFIEGLSSEQVAIDYYHEWVLPDDPIDAVLYARVDGKWVQVYTLL